MSMRRALPFRWSVVTFALLAPFAMFECRAAPSEASKGTLPVPKTLETLYAGGMQNGWMDYGWSPHELGKGPAKLDLSQYGGWILGKPGTKGSTYGGLVFEVTAPLASKLEVRVEGQGQFPKVKLDTIDPIADLGSMRRYFVPMAQLNPRSADFDQVVFQGREKGLLTDVLIDNIGLTAIPTSAPVVTGPAVDAKLTVDCLGKALAISPYIYGVAYDVQRAEDDTAWTALGATARRWGGNNASRYNWQINAWNAGADWYFHNLEYTGIKGFTYDTFLEQDRAHGIKTALTIPMLGWVAKDTVTASFQLGVYPKQEKLDPSDMTCGNGKGPKGENLDPPPPALTSVRAPPEFMQKWVETIRAKDNESKRGRSVHLYFLDNEPSLWWVTHRDVHPEPTTYDELWDKSVAYAQAIRKADPEALIAGPAEWGWTGYLYSAADAQAGTFLRPDRRKHQDLPLIAWYLKKAAEHEKKTGERIIDVLDLHFYPQGRDVGNGEHGGTDPNTNALRLRSTRALWDPNYKDESWIAEPIRLIPRMKEWIDTYYPGRGIALGEYSFGAQGHPSGGLAQAEALGRFAQFGVSWAFAWMYPPKGSPGAQAFAAYRNYDGHGAHFQDFYLNSKSTLGGVTSFASRDDAGRKLVLVALNNDPGKAVAATVDVSTCGNVSNQRVFQTTFGDGLSSVKGAAKGAKTTLPPYSITVIELELESKGK